MSDDKETLSIAAEASREVADHAKSGGTVPGPQNVTVEKGQIHLDGEPVKLDSVEQDVAALNVGEAAERVSKGKGGS